MMATILNAVLYFNGFTKVMPVERLPFPKFFNIPVLDFGNVRALVFVYNKQEITGMGHTAFYTLNHLEIMDACPRPTAEPQPFHIIPGQHTRFYPSPHWEKISKEDFFECWVDPGTNQLQITAPHQMIDTVSVTHRLKPPYVSNGIVKEFASGGIEKISVSVVK